MVGPKLPVARCKVTFGAWLAMSRMLSLAARLEHLGGDGRDGDRRVLQILCTELRGDQHLIQCRASVFGGE